MMFHKVKAVNIVLDRTKRDTHNLGKLSYQFNLATRITYLFLHKASIGMPSVNKSGFLFDEHLNAANFLDWTFFQVKVKT